MRFITGISIVSLLLLTGCATPIPLNTLTYEQKTTVTSSREATVLVVSGAIRGGSGSYMMPVGGILVPVSTGPHPELQFNSKDQQAFAESLRNELVRLGIVKTASGDASQAKDLKMQIIFAQTFHNPNIQQYTLDVVAEFTGGKEPVLRTYRVISSEKDTTWEKLNTNAYEGKAKAARLLMERLIPDIELYVAAM